MSREAISHIVNEFHLVPILIIVGAFVLNFLLRKYLAVFFEKSATHLNVDVTRYHFIKNASTAIILGGAIAFAFYSIPSLRSLGATIFAGAGILAAVIAFASQEAMSNIVGGVFLVIFKPFRVGDIIQIGEQYMGEVEDINLRHTIINSFENRRIIIPNAIINNQTITNSNIKDSKICRFIEIGIAYDADIDKAREIIRKQAKAHPFFIDNRTREQRKNNEDPLAVRVISLGDFAVTLRAYFWAEGPMKARVAEFDLLESIKKNFDEEGVEIPFPYRTIVYKNDLKKGL